MEPSLSAALIDKSSVFYRDNNKQKYSCLVTPLKPISSPVDKMSMEGFKDKILICSLSQEFLKPFQSTLNKYYDVQVANTADMCLFLAREWEPSVCLIDGDSPLLQSVGPLRELERNITLGLIVLCSQDNLFKEEKAFRAGADHFLVVSEEVKRLNWRIQSLLRKNSPLRSNASSGREKAKRMEALPAQISFGSIKIYPHDFLIKLNEEIVSATPTQFKLFLAFVTHRDQLLSRNWLKQTVWDDADISPRSIDAQISKLKKLLPELDQYLVNIYGKGYILTHPKESAA